MNAEMADRIACVEDLGVLWSLTTGFFHELGFAGVTYLLLQRGQWEEPLAIFYDGADKSFIAYSEMGYARNDPAARHALATGNPLRVDELPELTAFSRQEARKFRALQELGAHHILVLPVFGPNTTDGMFALSAQGNPALLDEVNFGELQATAQLIHLRTINLQPELPRTLCNPLSDREIEILRWVAQGKSNAVIAEILEIAPATVDTYLRRIFDKLDVADRTAAAVRGVSYGYIRA